MPFVGLSLVLQILLAVHVVRTGRPYYWIYLIVFVPIVGAAAYVIAELAPEWMGSRTAHQLRTRATRAIDPDRDYRRLSGDLEDAATADRRRALAEELIQRERFEEAAEQYRAALAPPHQDDPTLLMGLARCQFLAGRPEQALETLDALQAANPDFRSTAGHLLYARSLEEAGRQAEALDEYRALVGQFPGEEAKARYARLLEQAGRRDEALTLWREIKRSVERAPRHYLRDQREWYDAAQQALGQ